MSGVLYSPRPPEAYTVVYMGVRFGYGSYPPLTKSLPAWNLFWLAYPPVDELLTWPASRAGEVPCYNDIVGGCVTVGGGRASNWLVNPRPDMAVAYLAQNWEDLGLNTHIGSSRTLLGHMQVRASEAAARLAGGQVQATASSDVVTPARDSNIIPFRRKP